MGLGKYETLEEGIPSLQQKRNNRLGANKFGVVGARGFEPPTPASRTQCATGLRYAPTTSTASRSERGLSYIRGSKRKP